VPSGVTISEAFGVKAAGMPMPSRKRQSARRSQKTDWDRVKYSRNTEVAYKTSLQQEEGCHIMASQCVVCSG
jgi:hypothetical protein